MLSHCMTELVKECHISLRWIDFLLYYVALYWKLSYGVFQKYFTHFSSVSTIDFEQGNVSCLPIDPLYAKQSDEKPLESGNFFYLNVDDKKFMRYSHTCGLYRITLKISKVLVLQFRHENTFTLESS